MVIRFAWIVLVQQVQLWVGLIAEVLAPHAAEVKMEAVQQEVNFDPGPPGLWTHSRSGTQDEGGAIDCTARLELEEGAKQRWMLQKYELFKKKHTDAHSCMLRTCLT